MKGYISVNDNRSFYLKQIFIQNGYAITGYQEGLDFYYIDSDHQPLGSLVFTLNDSRGNFRINDDPDFRHFNNTLTVAGFLLAVQKTCMINKKILILGFGDLARQLAKVLKINNEITIANRNYKNIDEIKKDYQHIDIHLMTGYYDYIINTIPSPDIDYQDLKYECIYDLANTLCLDRYVSLRNLPNRYFPYESAWLMFQSMDKVMRNAKR